MPNPVHTAPVPQIGVALFSDDPFTRDGIRAVLQRAPSMMFLDADLAPRDGGPTPDVLLVDSRTEEVLERFAGRTAERPRLIFLFVPNDLWAADALWIGARGIIGKDEPLTDVVRAIAAVQEGKVWAPRHVVLDAWLHHSHGSLPNRRVAMFEHRLSARERQVVHCVAAGMSSKELAQLLGISPSTVKAHLTHIFEKLGVKTRAELIAAFHGAMRSPLRKSPKG